MHAPGSGVGRKFGPYELRALLGEGGMGEVYEAYDTVKDRVVALKLLGGDLVGDPEYQTRFRRESQAAARLAEPHVIPIHDWGVIEGRLFIDMRLVAGRDLSTILAAEGPLSPQRAVAVIEQIAAALDAAHTDGLVHRDVKPANILVTADDFAYLADFGIAHHEGDGALTRAGVAVGSFTYMAPERFDNVRATPRADIYSLSCVLHECLTGASPFSATSAGVLIRAHLTDQPPRASVTQTGIPGAFDDVIACGMAKDPHERFATASELAVAARTALKSPARPSQQKGDAGPRTGEYPATPGNPTADVAPPTGGIPTLVVRMPRRDEDGLDSTTVLPAIIPGDPTSIRPTDTELTPYTADEEPDIEAPGAGIRPFPDAHLYQGDQLHPAAAPAPYPGSAPPTGGIPVTDFSPPHQATRIYGVTHPGSADPEQTTRVFEPAARGPAGLDPFAHYSGDETTRVHQPAEEPRSATGDWWTSGVGEGNPPAQPGPGDFMSPRSEGYSRESSDPQDDIPGGRGPAGYGSPGRGPEAYSDLGRGDGHSSGSHGAAGLDVEEYGPGGYGPEVHGAGRNGPEAYSSPEAYSAQGSGPVPPPDPYAAAYEAGYRDSYAANTPRRTSPHETERSRVIPITAGIGVFALVVILAVFGIQFLGSDAEPSPAAATTGAAATSFVRTSAPATTTTSARRSTTKTTSAAPLPAGAQPCGSSSENSAAYSSAAAGTTVTSCAFAEAVRQAYLDPAVVSATGEPVAIEAISPVTGQSYALECVAEDGLVTCSGGNNAVVYLY